MKELILASQSPRRKQLLEAAGLTFRVQSVPTKETFPEDMPPQQAPAYIATEKAQSLWATLSPEERTQSVVLAADTIVVSEGEILGKPKDDATAISYLKALSGKHHDVITGYCLLDDCGAKSYVTQTQVFFRTLTEAQIAFYVRQYQPFDKAGAYAIQEWIGLIGVERIEGDYYNVVGLPVGQIVRQLSKDFPDVLPPVFR